MKRLIILISGLLLFGFLGYYLTKDHRNNSSKIQLNIGVLKHESSLPIYIADSLGYFKENGLFVKIVELPPGDHLPALISDRVDIISPTSFPMLLGAMESNPNLFFSIMPGAELINGETVYGIVTQKDFIGSDIFSLKNKKILAINPYTKVNLLNILKKINFNEKEINEINVVNRDVALSALSNGEADACILDQPSLAVALQSGNFKLLESNPRAKYLGSPYWSGSGAIKQEKWENKNIEIRKYLLSIDKAIEYINNNKKESQNILAKKLGLEMIISTQMGGYYFPKHYELVDLKEIEKTEEALINSGLMKKKINLNKLFPENIYNGKL